MAVISCFTFNGENQILKLHLGVLYNYVDRFIILEANRTFTGEDKPLLFFRDERFFNQWGNKIDYFPLTRWDNVPLWQQAVESPNTRGADHWKREFYIKESLKDALALYGPDDDDLIILGDVDEIIDPTVTFESDSPIKAKLRVYTYWLNNRSNERFWGPLMARYGDIKDECLNHMRSDRSLYSKGPYLGWHFTSIGGFDKVVKKLEDSYTRESYFTDEVRQNLAQNIEMNRDFLGRDFKYCVDETEWPQYLKDNRNLFAGLCR